MSDDFPKLRLGISSCLLGEKVRYDGSHKNDNFVSNVLTRFFDFVTVCPEVGIGMGIPRPTIRLVNLDGDIRALGVKEPSLDPTEPLSNYIGKVESRLQGISGYILKKDSPSCGMTRVKVYSTEHVPPNRDGVGLYAKTLMERFPLLPLEEEGRLNDPHLRESFITRIFVYRRWQTLLEKGITPGTLVEFHTRHKLLVMSHNQEAYRRLGQLVANAGKASLETLADEYIAMLMDTLKRRANNKKHANVLYHLMGYLKQKIDSDDKAELVETIETYREGRLPLIVPITLLKHHFRRHPTPYVENQVYLEPHPAELMLRNVI